MNAAPPETPTLHAAPPETPTLTDYHAEGVLTALERDALALRFPDWPNSSRKLSSRQLVAALGVSRSTVRDRISNGLRKIAAHEEANAA